MNYYMPRQRDTDKRWDYTCKNDNRIWPVGYCAGAEGHHATEEEAYQCYTKWLLENRLSLDRKLSGMQLKCEVCGVYTEKQALVDHTSFTLCETHLTREHVEKLFGTVGDITSSW
jgi:hypothetical protein